MVSGVQAGNDPARASVMHAGAGAWADLPGYSIFDIIAVVWREKWTALATALIVTLIGAAIIYTQMPRLYTAVAQVLVLPDEAYDPDTIIGEDSPFRGGLMTEQVVRAEEEILRSEVIKRRVVAERGIANTFPDLLEGRGTAAPDRLMASAIISFNQSFGTSLREPVITAVFRAEDPVRAAEVLNDVLDEYLRYRLEVLLGEQDGSVAAERDAAEARLLMLNKQIRTIQDENDIGDFDADLAALNARIATVESELVEARANAAAARSRLQVLESRTAETAEEVELYVEDQAGAALESLLLERQQLSSRYRPESRIIRNLDAQIAAVRQQIAEQDGPRGARRVGVNPVRQSLETERAQVAGQSSAEQARLSALVAQLRELRARQSLLQELRPQFRRLDRERIVLEENVARITQSLEQRRARLSLQDQRVRIIQEAQPPVRGQSGRLIAGLGVVALAGLLGLIAALIRGFSRGAPTKAAASRSLGMDVLAVVPARQAKGT